MTKGLWVYCRPYTMLWVAGFVLSVGNVSSGLAIPRLVGKIIDDLRAGAPAGALVPRYALLIVLAAAGASVLGATMRLMGPVAARRVGHDLRAALFHRLTLLEPAYYQRTRTGDLISRFTGDVAAVAEMLGFGVVGLVNLVLTVAVTFYFMLGVSVQLGLVVMAGFPVVFGLVVWMLRVATRRHALVQAQLAELSSKVQENLSGIRLIKASGTEDREERDFRVIQDRYQRLVMRYMRLELPVRLVLSLALNVAVAASLLLGARQLLLSGSGAVAGLSLGGFVAFITYLSMLLMPLLWLGQVFDSFQRGAVSWARLRQVLEAEPVIRDGPRALAAPAGEVCFEEVSLTVGGRVLLDKVSFRIPPGHRLGVTGRTGAGKSLVGSLLVRMIEPTSGRVLIDGAAIGQLTLDSLRSSVGVVPQEPFLFSRTIGENIGLGLAGPDQVRAAAAAADLLSNVEAFPGKFDTVLGERGVTLSGGQRQRTALARTLVRKTPIMILDDALSAVDAETESRILTQLKTTLDGHTVLLIGHRISTLRHADEILVLDEGKVVERGTHQELIARGGLYAELDHRQRLAEALQRHG